MLIIPAVDIRNGKCVRLTQGNFEFEKVYSDDPVDMAKQWEEQGAQMIHVVDLDGAKNGNLANLEIIKRIVQEVKIPVEVGGGIRNQEAVRALLSSGVSRVVLGTVALENDDELQNILNEFASQVAIALDTKDGKLMKQGWFEESDRSSVTTALKLEYLGVKRFIYTDVVRDGTLTKPNYKEIANFTKNVFAPVIVGGGISSINSIKQLKTMRIEGLIIGKALYERELDLREAIHAS